MSRLYVDVHVLQTVPPSNVNRDDAGSPKQAMYGGVRRARVSSQAWKRATRKGFADVAGANMRPLATRTKRLGELLQRCFETAGQDRDTAESWAEKCVNALGIKPDAKNKKKTAVLLFLGVEQIDGLARYAAETLTAGGKLDKKAMEAVLRKGHPIDVALFGRMVADVADLNLNVDAATQVAHALSTHAVDIEFDYYTAVDDENEAGETGAGMIGIVEFSSATLYRFASLGVHQLRDNVDGDDDTVTDGLRAFLTSFVTSMPTGHQNSFAHRTHPELVTLVVRDDQPVNLVSAFEDPITGPGIAHKSVARLADELDRSSRLWGTPPRLVVSTYEPRDGDSERDLTPLGELLPFTAAVERVLTIVGTSTTRASQS